MQFKAAGLAGVRLILTAVVMRYHCAKTLSVFPRRSLGFRDGRLMVPFFFVMSGFFSYMSLSRLYARGGWLSSSLIFIARRCLPVVMFAYALHFLWIAVLPEKDLLPPGGWRAASEPIFYRFYVRLDEPSAAYAPNIVMWYTSVQVLFWMVSPLFVTGLVRLRHMRKPVFALALLIDFGMTWMCPDDIGLSQAKQDSIYTHPLLRLPTYFCGMAFGCFMLEGSETPPVHPVSKFIGPIVDLFLIGAILSINIILRHELLTPKSMMATEAFAFNWLFVLLFYALATPFLSARSTINKILSSRWMKNQAQGSMQYMFFSIHIPVVTWATGWRNTRYLMNMSCLIYVLGVTTHNVVYCHLQQVVNLFLANFERKKPLFVVL